MLGKTKNIDNLVDLQFILIHFKEMKEGYQETHMWIVI